MSNHHSFEEKLKYMKLLDEGYPMRQLSRETKIVRSRLYIWRKRYIYYGEEGLRILSVFVMQCIFLIKKCGIRSPCPIHHTPDQLDFALIISELYRFFVTA